MPDYAARKAYRLFRENPNHPSLQFRGFTPNPIYSVHVTLGYRAVGLLEGDDVTWIGGRIPLAEE